MLVILDVLDLFFLVVFWICSKSSFASFVGLAVTKVVQWLWLCSGGLFLWIFTCALMYDVIPS